MWFRHDMFVTNKVVYFRALREIDHPVISLACWFTVNQMEMCMKTQQIKVKGEVYYGLFLFLSMQWLVNIKHVTCKVRV